MEHKNRTFNIFGSKWKIVFGKAVNENNEWILGYTTFPEKIITVSVVDDKGNPLEEREILITIKHEILHAICIEGLYSDINNDEPAIEWLAKCLQALQEQKII